MPKKIRKGMVLCAGLGTRLLPITDRYPKPVVPILNIPNLLHSLFLLERAGVEEAILNLHHIPTKIENFIRNTPKLKLKVSFSKETTLLGTGGGVKRAEAFFEGEPFVLANCDFVSNVTLAPYIDRHFDRNAIATMVLHEDPEMQAHYSKVGVDKDGQLCSLPKLETSSPKRTGIFTGIHILSNEIFKWLKEEPSGINEVLYPSLMKQHPTRVFADFTQNNYWYDTGDLAAFNRATMKLLDAVKSHDAQLSELLKSYGNDYVEKQPGIFAPDGESLPDAARVTLKAPVILGPRCQFGRDVVLGPYCVVGEDSVIADNFRAKQTVLLAGSKTKAGQDMQDAIWFQDAPLAAKKKPGKAS